jgi:gliding motility-associated-like protein
MQKLTTLIFCLLCSWFSLSQNEANIWYFGGNAGLDFNSGVPVPLLNGELNTNEGCATISDSSGSLLFYTDGTNVWNRDHQVMPNGTGLNGDDSSTQSAIIVPKPNDLSIYYIFTVDAFGGPEGLQYSEVDLTLDGGLGDITTVKNVLLETPVTEKISAIKSLSLNEYWIVAHKWQSNEFISYNISESGVNPNPVISAVGSFTGGPPNNVAIGQLKISPSGEKIVLAHLGLNQAQVCDFNSNTGVVSNAITIYEDLNIAEFPYGVEFSPNSELVYVSLQNGPIYQYNLEAGTVIDVIGSRYTIDTMGGLNRGLQLGPDGKIYVAKIFETSLDVIENPNAQGFACGYQANSVDLNGRTCFFGLPPFIQTFFNFNVGFQSENYCLGDATLFTLNTTQTYDAIEWDFGDGTTSTLENPTHTYNSAGDYQVSVTLSLNNQTAINEQTITINTIPVVMQPQDLLACDTDSDGFSVFDLTSQNEDILNGLPEMDFTISYHLSLNDAQNGSNTLDTNFTNTETQQTIYVRLENINTGCFNTTQFDVIVNEQPVLLMDDLWVICEGETVDIVADEGYDEYLWSTGETTQSITVNTPGIYEITVTNIYGILRCETNKSITVNTSNIATITDIDTDDWTLVDNSITVYVSGNGDYEYSLDGIEYQDSRQFNNVRVNEYTVYVRDKNGCGIVTEDVYLIYYPKFFTPNGDMVNDTWQIINGINEPQNVIYIYDRYGKLLKKLGPNSLGWDGTYNGVKMPTSDYWFLLKRQNGNQYKGHFTLKR